MKHLLILISILLIMSGCTPYVKSSNPHVISSNPRQVTIGYAVSTVLSQKLAEKTHIHFNLIREGGGGFISPSIFDQKIVQEFHRRWNLFPNDPDAPIPSCMGYMLEADENPFERKVVDSL